MPTTGWLYFAIVGLTLSWGMGQYALRMSKRTAKHWHEGWSGQFEANKKLQQEIGYLKDDLELANQAQRNAEAAFNMAVDFIKSEGIEPPVMVVHPDGGHSYPETIVIHEEP